MTIANGIRKFLISNKQFSCILQSTNMYLKLVRIFASTYINYHRNTLYTRSHAFYAKRKSPVNQQDGLSPTTLFSNQDNIQAFLRGTTWSHEAILLKMFDQKNEWSRKYAGFNYILYFHNNVIVRRVTKWSAYRQHNLPYHSVWWTRDVLYFYFIFIHDCLVNTLMEPSSVIPLNITTKKKKKNLLIFITENNKDDDVELI